MTDIAVIGGGASGIMCAISAKIHNKNASVTVFERAPKCLKKLLATGNGRCNLTNMEAGAANFYSSGMTDCFEIIKKFGPEEIVSFFESIGLLCTERFYPLIYPNSMQASSVRDVLLTAAYEKGVKIFTDCEIVKIEKAKESFVITDKKGKKYDAKKVVAAGGSRATSGSDSTMWLLKSVGHKIVEPYPALTALVCAEKEILKVMDGGRAYARVSLVCGGETVKSDIGEVQFCSYGLSGIVVMQLSGNTARIMQKGKKIYVSVSFLYDKSEKEILSMLEQRKISMGRCSTEKVISSMVSSYAAAGITTALKKDIGEKGEKRFDELEKSDIIKIAHLLCDLRFEVVSLREMKYAQVAGGGADLDMFDENLCSKLCNGLYAAGEALDVCGDCGGFNLTWAWASGYIAGKAAAEEL